MCIGHSVFARCNEIQPVTILIPQVGGQILPRDYTCGSREGKKSIRTLWNYLQPLIYALKIALDKSIHSCQGVNASSAVDIIREIVPLFSTTASITCVRLR